MSILSGKYRFLCVAFATLLAIKAFGQTELNTESIAQKLTAELNYLLLLQADSGNLDQVVVLIEAGASTNAANWDGTTALMYASQKGYYKVARELIARGAKLNATTNQRFSALHYACIVNHDSIAEMLILNGANVHPVNNNGVSPLHYSCAYGYPFLSHILISYGAQVDSTDKFGNTPLLTAVYSGSMFTSQVLLEAGANANKPDNNGITPLMVAAQFNDTTLIRLLLDYGANVDTKCNEGNTALAFAINSRAIDASLILIERGLKTDCFHPKTSYTELAIQKDLPIITRKLKDAGFKRPLKPRVRSTSVLAGFSSNFNDFFFLGQVQSTIPNWGITLTAGYGKRPYEKPVLIEDGYNFFQFFENRSIAYLSIDRKISSIYLSGNSRIIFGAGLMGIRSWGSYNYSSTLNQPQTYQRLSPMLSILYVKRGFAFGLNGYLLNTNQAIGNPLSIGIYSGFTINHWKPKFKPKQISWF